MSAVLDGQTTDTATLRSALVGLRRAIQKRKVVAVIGPDALDVQVPDGQGGTRAALFYRLVAEQLLQHYGLDLGHLDAPGPTWDLHRATQVVMAQTGQRAAHVRPVVSDIISELAEQAQPAGALRQLAQLHCFSLLVSLTPDDCLFQAFAAAQPQRRPSVHSYSLRTETGAADQDIPDASESELRIFQPLGRSDADEFAAHEEDALEYLHRFRDGDGRRYKNLLIELRENHLLFLGCSLPDWMGRGLMRLVNSERLADPERTKEFFCATARDARLSQFLERFSPQSTVLPWSPLELVTEVTRWEQEAPAAPAAIAPPAPQPAYRRATGPTAFVSYASEDAAAARQVAQALQQAGFADVWLDQRRLVVGDDWSQRIDEAIASCDYFVPLLSRQADARREGVYWEEWRKALARALRVADDFILPIGLDQAPPRRAGYQRIFTGPWHTLAGRHLAHAPGGQLTDDARDQLRHRVWRFLDGAGGHG